MLHTLLSLLESQTVRDIKEILQEIYLMLSNSIFQICATIDFFCVGGLQLTLVFCTTDLTCIREHRWLRTFCVIILVMMNAAMTTIVSKILSHVPLNKMHL